MNTHKSIQTFTTMFLFILGVGLAGCGENPLIFPVETITTTRNTEEETEKMDTSDTKTDEVVEFFDNYADLLDFLGLDFTGMEIASIDYDVAELSKMIILFLNGSEDSFLSNQSNEFLILKSEPLLSPPHIKRLETWGIDTNDIQAVGWSVSVYENEEGGTESIDMYWYFLDNSCGSYEGNIYLRIPISYPIKIDAEKIISSQGE